ncbi:MAG: hypothetical protein KDA78_12485 [Planctomycetaceae bacterium]|nr:hypothetical protein [Planctomycetaceae bacterium]
MSRQFTVQTFFRCVSVYALREFFDHLKLNMDLEWGKIRPNNIQPIIETFDRLDRADQAKAEIAMREIHTLCGTNGSESITQAAALRKSSRFDKFIARDATVYEKAVWCWIYCPSIFRQAQQLHYAENLTWWRKRNDLPHHQPDTSVHAIKQLGRGLSKLLMDNQWRGGRCTVDWFEHQGTYYFLAYPDDYMTRIPVHTRTGNLVCRKIRPTFTVAFAFCPEDGSLELHMLNNRMMREKVEQVFAREILAHNLVAWKEFVTYDLDHLKYPGTVLSVDPVDKLYVKIHKMRLTRRGSQQRVHLEIDPGQHQDSIHLMMSGMLNLEQNPLEELIADRVTICFEFLQKQGRKAGKKCVEIGYPATCNMRNTHPHWEPIILKYLKRWGIHRDQSQSTEVDSSPLGHYAAVHPWG